MDLSAASRLGPGRPGLTPADVADMLDTLDAVDVRTTIAGLEDLLATVRRAPVSGPVWRLSTRTRSRPH